MNTPRIAILGTGAVGGYFGGLLAGKFSGTGKAEIIFIVRPATKEIILKNGLKLITENEERIFFPDLVSSDANEIGKINLLICCIKSYDLEESLLPLKQCITPETIILPLLNGVDAPSRIKKILPDTEVWKGCVYIVSRLIERGVVKELGTGHSFYFGSDTASKHKLNKYNEIFREAGINSFVAENIDHTVWEKFIFISSLASLTSYLDKPLGAILDNQEYLQMLKDLMKELLKIAKAKGITFPDNIIETRIQKMKTLAYETTSSMHSDFKKGGKTEYKSLTEYVVELGKKLKIETPLFSLISEKLAKRTK